MKKLLFPLSIIALVACNNTENKATQPPQKTDTTPNIVKVDSYQVIKKRAMELMHLSLDAFKKSVDGSLSNEQAIKLTDDYEKEFNSIIGKLSKEDSTEIYNTFEKRTDEILKLKK